MGKDGIIILKQAPDSLHKDSFILCITSEFEFNICETDTSTTSLNTE